MRYLQWASLWSHTRDPAGNACWVSCGGCADDRCAMYELPEDLGCQNLTRLPLTTVANYSRS